MPKTPNFIIVKREKLKESISAHSTENLGLMIKENTEVFGKLFENEGLKIIDNEETINGALNRNKKFSQKIFNSILCCLFDGKYSQLLDYKVKHNLDDFIKFYSSIETPKETLSKEKLKKYNSVIRRMKEKNDHLNGLNLEMKANWVFIDDNLIQSDLEKDEQIKDNTLSDKPDAGEDLPPGRNIDWKKVAKNYLLPSIIIIGGFYFFREEYRPSIKNPLHHSPQIEIIDSISTKNDTVKPITDEIALSTDSQESRDNNSNVNNKENSEVNGSSNGTSKRTITPHSIIPNLETDEPKLHKVTYSGTVRDWDTDEPIKGVKITIAGHTITTDNDGRFTVTFEGKSEFYNLDAYKKGYKLESNLLRPNNNIPIKLRK